MRTSSFVLAAIAVAFLGSGQMVRAQYGPMGGPAVGPYPDMMAPSYMPGPGFPGAAPQGPYAPPAFAPASYAGIGGPAPMGPMPSGMPSGGMPMDSGGGEPCYPANGVCDGWTHHYFGFGEFLYLRPRNSEVAYAVPIDSAAAGGGAQVQTGLARVVDLDYSPSFRAGFGAVISPRSALAVSYTQFDRSVNDIFSVGGPNVIRSLVSHPNSPVTAAGDGTDTGADLQTQFQLIDGDFKGLLIFNDEYEVNYVVGGRYANLEQHFFAGFTAGLGSFEDVHAESEFDGGGVKIGLEGMRLHRDSQFFCYGKSFASFLGGTFRARYSDIFSGPQSPTANPAVTGFNVDRLVTMLDLETGIGWQSFSGNFRLSAGYMYSAWFNTVKVNEFINAVQNNNFVDPSTNFSGTISFDGLTSKIEVLW